MSKELRYLLSLCLRHWYEHLGLCLHLSLIMMHMFQTSKC